MDSTGSGESTERKRTTLVKNEIAMFRTVVTVSKDDKVD